MVYNCIQQTTVGNECQSVFLYLKEFCALKIKMKHFCFILHEYVKKNAETWDQMDEIWQENLWLFFL